MPELPEVETIKEQLRSKVLNKRIKGVSVRDKRLLKGVSVKKFKSQLEGKTIKDIIRRGKVLILKLEENLFLILHLRISGWIIAGKKEAAFSRVILVLSDNTHLQFCDARALGEIRIIDDWQQLSIIQTMGPEPLTLQKKEFTALFKDKKTRIKPLLMDQRFLAGIGNMYAQESLFCAGIYPEKSAQRLHAGELGKLYECLLTILRTAIRKQGSSVNTYRQINGNEGGYVPFLKVYQREGKLCIRCKTLIRRKTIGGRGTYFCPRCQQ